MGAVTGGDVWPNAVVLARFAVGAEAVDDGLGVVVVERHEDLYRVHVVGGVLPDGTEMRLFRRPALAFQLALAVVQALSTEETAQLEEG